MDVGLAVRKQNKLSEEDGELGTSSGNSLATDICHDLTLSKPSDRSGRSLGRYPSWLVDFDQGEAQMLPISTLTPPQRKDLCNPQV